MADLSAYINFTVTLDKSVIVPVIKVINTGDYAGLETGITGIVKVTQPDGLSVEGSFGSPDMIYTSGAFTVASKLLRLTGDGKVQNGTYVVRLTLRCTGYQDTVLERTFVMNYTQPEITFAGNLNTFQPLLTVLDTTDYDVAQLIRQSLVRTWLAVVGPYGTTTGPDVDSLDLQKASSYYDTTYNVTLQSVVHYILTSYNWVLLYDKIVYSQIFEVYAPKSLNNLLADITSFKTELDQLIGSRMEYALKQANYTYAMALFNHIRYRGAAGQLAGLSDYIDEIGRVLNDNVEPVRTHTDLAITSYSWA